MDAWSIVKVVDSGLKVVGVNTGVIGGVLSGPIGVATSATLLIKKWVDSENSKIFESVKKRESCPHIVMVEGWPLGASALLYVSNFAGVAWRFGEIPLYFYHKEEIFRPTVFSEALVRGKNGVASAKNASEFSALIKRPKDGYGCSECKNSASLRKK